MAHMGAPNGLAQVANAEVERHIRQNNERLICIQRHLQSPDAFEKAAKELLEWCSDPRAFQRAFEHSLMNCLTVISEVAPKPGFNLSLGYRLLAVCSANRDKFSPKSSGHLHAWCEDLGKLLLLQHHNNNRPNEGMRPVVPSPSPNSHNPMDSSYGPGGPMGSRMGYPPDGSPWNHNMPDPNHRNINGSMHQRPALSVTTTVWGVSNATQSPAIRGQGHAPMNQYSMGPNPTPHPRPQSMGYHMSIYNQKSGPYGGSGPYPRNEYGSMNTPHRGMPGPGYGPNNTPHQVHHMRPDTGEYAPPAAAAAAAAVAAAAATATATATAMVVNDQQQQQQNDMYGQMGQHTGGSMHPMDPSGHNGAPGPMSRDPNMSMEAIAPGSGRPPIRHNMYNQFGPVNKGIGPGPVPHHANSPSAPPPNHGMSGYNSMNQQFRPAYRSNSNSYGPTSPYATPSSNQFKSPSMSGHPPPSGFSPRVPTPGPLLTATPGPDMYPSVSSAGNVPPYYNSQSTSSAGGLPPTPNGPMGFTSPRPNFNPQFGPMNRGPHQHQPPDPMPGNPTPPITPGSAHNVPPFPGPDVKPQIPIDVKPNIGNHGAMQPMDRPTPSPIVPPQNNNSNEMRMTFPVRDGVVLQPFRLEHNRSVSTRAFQLRQTAYDTLMWRPDLELEFKCYHHDDKMQHTNWPHSVQVTVNGTKMHISRNPCKPLYLREVCKDGRNTIDIEVSTCCCSHYFLLQLVHRPSVRSVLMGLLSKRMLPATNCVTKIKRFLNHRLTSGAPGALVRNTAENGFSPADDNSTVLSLRCPITYKRIILPARGSECKHIPCFDLEAYLQLNSDKRTWSCPICHKQALLEGLEVDQYIWGILTQSHPEDMEVIIDSKCTWKPIVMKGYGGGDEEGPARKRMRSTGMSPATMFNRLPSPGSYVPQMTPLPPARLTMTPDMTGSGTSMGPNTGGCGYHNGNNNLNRTLTKTPLPHTNGQMMGMGRPNGPLPTPGGPPGMGMNNHSAQGGMLHRANPLQLEDVVADDRVTIKKALNPARAPSLSATPNPPNVPMGNQPPPASQLLRQNNNNGQCIRSPSSLSQQHADQRLHNPNTPSNPGPGTPSGNPKTPSMDILSPQTQLNNTNHNPSANFQTNRHTNSMGHQHTSTPSNTTSTSDLNFDPNMVISGTGIGENDDKIPSLDILPENTDPLELIDYLGTGNAGDPNEDDIFSIFDSAN